MSEAASAAITPLEVNAIAVSPLRSPAPRSSSAPLISARKSGQVCRAGLCRARVDPLLEGLVEHDLKVARAQRGPGVAGAPLQSRLHRRVMREHVVVVELVPALVDRRRPVRDLATTGERCHAGGAVSR